MKLQDLKKLADEATPGPWEAKANSDNSGLGRVDNWGKDRPGAWPYEYCPGPFKDAAFIAAARTYLPKLIAVAEAAAKLEPHSGTLEMARRWTAFEKTIIALEAEP